MNAIKLECPNCKAPLTAERGRSFMFCEYCGTKIMLDDIRFYHEDAVTERHRITEEHKTKRELEKDKAKRSDGNKMLFGMFGLLFVLTALLVFMELVH